MALCRQVAITLDERVGAMQLTINLDEPLEKVLEVVAAVYGVSLVTEPAAPGGVSRDILMEYDDGEGVTKIRH